MNRFLCVWLPNWPIHRRVVEQPALSHRPIVLFTRDSRQRQIVQACSSSAKSMGVQTGMLLADATALIQSDQLIVEEHDPESDQHALSLLADWCNQFSPIVAVDPAESPDSLYLDLNGVTHLFGDEPALANQLLSGFHDQGYRPAIGIADTPSAAWAAACFLPEQINIVPHLTSSSSPTNELLDLPIEALRLSEQELCKLDRLGLYRIRQLVELPRQSLPSRLGEQVLEQLDCLLGQQVETISAQEPVIIFGQQWLLDHPVKDEESIRHIVQVLLQRLADQLGTCGEGANQLSLCLDCEDQSAVNVSTGLYQASADGERFNRLIQTRLETTSLESAVTCVTVKAENTEPLEEQQRSLLGYRKNSNPRELADLVERLASRLGEDQVVRALPVDDWQPEKAFCFQALTQGKSTTAVSRHTTETTYEQIEQQAARPLRMFFPPQPIQVSADHDGFPARFRYENRDQRIKKSWGPERLETAWWRGSSIKREYYRVETESANCFWLFHQLDNKQWFLQGSFD